jgi:hypothetical protein
MGLVIDLTLDQPEENGKSDRCFGLVFQDDFHMHRLVFVTGECSDEISPKPGTEPNSGERVWREFGWSSAPLSVSLPLARKSMVALRPLVCQSAAVKVREIVRRLEEDGWFWVRTRGSHHQYKH